MFNGNGFLAIPVLIPFLAAVLLPALKVENPGAKRLYTIGAAAVTAAAMSLLCWRGTGTALVLYRIDEGLAVGLKLDGLAVLYTLLVAILWVGIVIYSHGYIHHDRHENRYYSFLLALLGSLLGLGMADNIVSFYLFYELMTFIAFPLICHSTRKEDVQAAITFLVYSIFGATLALIGIVLLNGMVDIGSFTPGGLLDTTMALLHGNVLKIALLLLLFGFGCKAGMYPLQAWLPVAHPAAPAPVSAPLSALITKAGVLGIIRVIYYMVGTEALDGTWIQYLWLSVTLLTVFMGSMLAFREPMLKKRLAYSSISQISYVLFGLAVLSAEAFTGALLQMVFHAFAKLILFLCAGVIIHETGKQRVDELKGIGKEMNTVMWCFTLAALSLIGIPPMGGFVSKWYLITAALAAPIGIFSWLGPVVLLVSALLTAGYLLPIVIAAFFPGADYDYSKRVKRCPSPYMTGPLVVLSALAILLALFPHKLTTFFAALAGSLV